MRRFLLGAVAASLLTFTGSATAVAAHHGKRHHRTHHAARHRHHHAARVLRFGVAAFTTSGAPAQAPTSPSDENAGTVKSFTGGVLTITLADETEVSGKVTEATRVRCESTTPKASEDDEQGDDNQGDDDGQGDDNQGDEPGSAVASAASNDSGDDDGAGNEACTTAALAPGAVVRGAELRLSSAGAVWEEVELLT
jgi:hypothetical protein